jgi:hypothetical protein
MDDKMEDLFTQLKQGPTEKTMVLEDEGKGGGKKQKKQKTNLKLLVG